MFYTDRVLRTLNFFKTKFSLVAEGQNWRILIRLRILLLRANHCNFLVLLHNDGFCNTFTLKRCLHRKVDFKTNELNNVHVSQLLHYNAGLQSSPECALQVYILTSVWIKNMFFNIEPVFLASFCFLWQFVQEQYGFERNVYQNKVI